VKHILSKRMFFYAVMPVFGALLLTACASGRISQLSYPLPQAMPPAGLSIQQVPQFICFGTDDNGYSGLEGSGGGGGLHFLTAIFTGRKNQAGSNNPRTFDGSPWHYSFYVNTYYIVPDINASSAYASTGKENPVFVKRAWKEALEHGHEIGNHTHSHPHGNAFSVRRWLKEMRLCSDILGRPYDDRETVAQPNLHSGLGIPRLQLIGFRTPFLEYNNDTLKAARRQGFLYDCSLEEGFETGQDGGNFLWPYRLDRGSPGNPQTIGRHPGLWEIPVYAFIVPPDNDCEPYGVLPGLRDKLGKIHDYFNPAEGKITGMDWNLWCDFRMDPAEFLATLKYTLDRRLAGNRAPMTVGLHSELYSDKHDAGDTSTSVAERRAALREFLDYVQAIPEARVVSGRELLHWLRQPVPLDSQGE